MELPDNVKMTEDQYGKLVERFGADEAATRIETLSLQMHAKGYKYKSHYHDVLAWKRREVGTKTPAPPVATFKRFLIGHDHQHVCPGCEPEHPWECHGIDNDGWPCGMRERAACKLAVEKYRAGLYVRNERRG